MILLLTTNIDKFISFVILYKNKIDMKRFILTILIAVGLTTASFAQDQIIGEIRLFAGNFAPRGWAFCNGQTVAINQNQALFSILGTTYGGNGVSTFALPDLRGRVPVHAGFSQGPGLSLTSLGEMGGTETTTLHPNVVSVKTTNVSLDTKTTGRDGAPMVVNSVTVDNPTTPQVISNRPPYLGLNYIICMEGIYPMRN
jgi:microcystin-dependent protein